jgi:hypothetical protein
MRKREPWKRWTLGAPILLALVFGSTACASSGSSTPRGDRNVLTHEALVETGEPDLQQAIQRLRPDWLRPRGQTIAGRTVAVFIDGAPRGDIGELRGMQIINVLEVTFVSASEAGFRYGTLAGAGGVIDVKTRR